MEPAARPLILGCGALARELRLALDASGLGNCLDVTYLPANLHNHPDRIVPTLKPLIDAAILEQRPVFIGYADCGTGGLLDALLAQYPDVQRLPGAHCYELFAGAHRFASLQAEAPGTFYLTDFLALHFEALVWNGLGLDRHPQLRDVYFGNYTRVVYLAQDEDGVHEELARTAAVRLGLAFEVVMTGRAGLDEILDWQYGAA